MAAERELLGQLDELLARVRLTIQRPHYRQRLLAGLDVPGGITTVRLLRAVETLSGETTPSITDVAVRLAVEHSTASRAVDTAVRSGLIEKHPCRSDMRRTRVALTDHGYSILEQASTRRRQLLDEVTKGWHVDDLDRLVDLLSALQAGFDSLERSE